MLRTVRLYNGRPSAIKYGEITIQNKWYSKVGAVREMPIFSISSITFYFFYLNEIKANSVNIQKQKKSQESSPKSFILLKFY